MPPDPTHEAQLVVEEENLILFCDCRWERHYRWDHISPPLRLVNEDHAEHVRCATEARHA